MWGFCGFILRIIILAIVIFVVGVAIVLLVGGDVVVDAHGVVGWAVAPCVTTYSH